MATSPVSPSDKAKPQLLVAFGAAVRRLRKTKGFSQEAFADACGINRGYMGGIERGEHNLALINIMKIIDALEIPPSEFFCELDDWRNSSN
jgi:transcriptional regulator with XRE-family HTH domain